MKKGRVCDIANQQFMNEQKQTARQLIATARGTAEASPARLKLQTLFDANTFVETGVFVARSGIAGQGGVALEGVVTGYGAINGELVYAFAQDGNRMHGAMDENHAKKIESLYHLALSNGAPMVGIFDCSGASIYEGVSAMAAYGRVLSCVTEASGAIPQIAIVDGLATGTMAAVVAMFDFVLSTDKASLYVVSPALTGANQTKEATGDYATCAGYARALVTKLPPVCDADVIETDTTDDANRPLSLSDFQNGMSHLLVATADFGSYLEVNPCDKHTSITAFATMGGVACGVLATNPAINEGRLTSFDARKLSRFVRFCNAFNLPVVTMVNSKGVDMGEGDDVAYAAELARLAQAYASADIPMVTVYVGSAIGSAYILLGSKAVGADVVYALPEAEIGALSADAAVAFVQNNSITSPEHRTELEENWKETVSSSLSAAAYGEVDDIIDEEELRARICSALYMMRGEGPTEKVGAIDTL